MTRELSDWDGLRNALVNHTTFPSNQSTDVNTDWERWKGLFLRVATEYIPLKSFKRRNSPPWIDGEVKRILSKKDNCRKRAKRDASPRLWEKFRELRRSAKTLIKAKRTEYFQKLPSLLKSSNKKFWSIFKSTSNHSNIPAQILL